MSELNLFPVTWFRLILVLAITLSPSLFITPSPREMSAPRKLVPRPSHLSTSADVGSMPTVLGTQETFDWVNRTAAPKTPLFTQTLKGTQQLVE
jgi:hypothetical protein